MSPIEAQFEVLKERFPEAVMLDGAGVSVVSVPGFGLPDGWSKRVATVHFLVPAGYPHANPDCFNVDADLRLANGAMPHSAQLQHMPLIGNTLWFSWHVQQPWKPGRDTLLTWLGVIADRFAKAQ